MENLFADYGKIVSGNLKKYFDIETDQKQLNCDISGDTLPVPDSLKTVIFGGTCSRIFVVPGEGSKFDLQDQNKTIEIEFVLSDEVMEQWLNTGKARIVDKSITQIVSEIETDEFVSEIVM